MKSVRDALITLAVLLVVLGLMLLGRACHESGKTEVTLSTMVRIGDGEWQVAECSTWVDGVDDAVDAKVWGVQVGNWYVTDQVVEKKPED